MGFSIADCWSWRRVRTSTHWTEQATIEGGRTQGENTKSVRQGWTIKSEYTFCLICQVRPKCFWVCHLPCDKIVFILNYPCVLNFCFILSILVIFYLLCVNNSLKWLAPNFSLQYYPWVAHWGHENTGNDQQLNKLLLLNKFSSSVSQEVYRKWYGEHAYWFYKLGGWLDSSSNFQLESWK